MIDDVAALWRSGWRMLALRAGPEDLPYSPRLTWAALVAMAAIYPAWMLVLTMQSPQPEDVVALPLIVWTLAPAGGMVGACALLLRAFGMRDRFHWISGLLPFAAILWYGVVMSHVWARTLERGYGVGLLMTLFQNAVMWVLPVVLLIGVISVLNLFN